MKGMLTGFLVASAVLFAAAAAAEDTNWQHDPATPGDWFDPGNWTNGVPTADDDAYVGNSGTASITAGEVVADWLRVGSDYAYPSQAEGTVVQSGGTCAFGRLDVGHDGIGTFTQSGGINTVTGFLFVGGWGFGKYELSGAAQLSAGEILVYPSSDALFAQAGDSTSVTADYLRMIIGRYELGGGILEVNDGAEFWGTLDFGGSSASARLGGLADLTAATVTNAGSASVTVKPDSLAIFAAGFDPYTEFGSFTNHGMTHSAGSTLEVGAGQGFTGRGTIGDHVDCEGTINATSGKGIDLLGGVSVSGNGSVNLGTGEVSVNDTSSGMSKAGNLSAALVSIGSAGVFTQAGGANNARYLSIETGGLYGLTGGALDLGIGAEVLGAIDFAGGAASVAAGGLVNLGSAALTNAGSASFTVQADSLSIFPAAFDPTTEFGSFTNNGMIHWAGSTLTVGPTQGFSGKGTISDRVECQGTINAATNEAIDLLGGIALSGSGSINLGGGELRVDDASSGMTGTGQLTASDEYVGHSGTGSFVHTAGANTITGYYPSTRALYVGFFPGSDGTYELGGTGELSATYEYIGHDGTGTFIQTGGTNTVVFHMYLGYNPGSSGTYTQTGGTNAITHQLWMGDAAGSNGRYELSGTGEVSAQNEYVGVEGSGTFSQSGGTNAISGDLRLGYRAGGSGSYELSNGDLSGRWLFVGDWGTGTFTQTGGSNTVRIVLVGNNSGSTGTFVHSGGTTTIAETLSLGASPNSSGTYELSGTAQLSATSVWVGDDGTGTFVHSGSSKAMPRDLYLGRWDGSNGSYELSESGELSAEAEYIGHYGTGTFTQTGGTNEVNGALALGWSYNSSGTYNLSDGSLSAGSETVGRAGGGAFNHTGGTNAITGVLELADSSASGTYELSGTGQLTAEDERIGCGGPGTFLQSGGINTVARDLYVGGSSSTGTYRISSGHLSAVNMYVGFDFVSGIGTLAIDGASAEIIVSALLHFGWRGTFTAVPGATIHMLGSVVENKSMDPAALAGLSNLTLIFEGGEPVASFEVAGRDEGAVPEGWVDSFALGTLQLGGSADIGRLRLVNSSFNQSSQEALYVNNLVFNAGAAIDLNGLNLYYLNGGDPKQLFLGDANLDGVVDGADYTLWADHYHQTGCEWATGDFNGDMAVDGADYTLWADNFATGGGGPVPEPAVLAVLGLGALALIRRRRA